MASKETVQESAQNNSNGEAENNIFCSPQWLWSLIKEKNKQVRKFNLQVLIKEAIKLQ